MSKLMTKEENIHSCFVNLFRNLLLHIYGILGANFPRKLTAFLKKIYIKISVLVSRYEEQYKISYKGGQRVENSLWPD